MSISRIVARYLSALAVCCASVSACASHDLKCADAIGLTRGHEFEAGDWGGKFAVDSVQCEGVSTVEAKGQARLIVAAGVRPIPAGSMGAGRAIDPLSQSGRFVPVGTRYEFELEAGFFRYDTGWRLDSVQVRAIRGLVAGSQSPVQPASATGGSPTDVTPAGPSASREDEAYVAAMKSDLRNLVTAEESYFADNVTYTRSLGTAFAPSAGVEVTIIEASGTGWSATARHARTTRTCGIFSGSGRPPRAGSEEGAPTCTPSTSGSPIATAPASRSSSREEQAYVAAMKSDLRNLVTAEESYFADNVTYARSLGATFAASALVEVRIVEATATGWSATARHARTTWTCGVFVGSGRPPLPGAEEGTPKCTP